MRIGLRFARKDAEYLRLIARRTRVGENYGPVRPLEFAAEAAETGEPLILECDSSQDAQRIAARFVRLGCEMPAIEELTGQRPAK